MSQDSFTEVTQKGLGGNLKDSLGGVVVGFLMFLISFPVLWWNEGRLDVSQVAKKAAVVDCSSVGPDAEGQLVGLTGELGVPDPVGDPEFLKPGPYAELTRRVEMFAWVEKSPARSLRITPSRIAVPQ